jgi:hypothetical protein
MCFNGLAAKGNITFGVPVKRSVNIAKLSLSDSHSLEQGTPGRTLEDMATKDGHRPCNLVELMPGLYES